jgi:hypothetical protein
MIFTAYLTPSGQEIYDLVSKRIKFLENPPICHQKDIYGWFSSSNKTITFCTDRIKSHGNASYYINETLYHESTHVAQNCKSLFGNNLTVLGINPSSIILSKSKEIDLKTVTSMLGEKSYSVEKEAFWIEDKPKQVIYYLKKFCF